MKYILPQETGKMRPLQEWSGLVGKCVNGHVLTPSHQESCLGWAFCPDCADMTQGQYCDIYFDQTRIGHLTSRTGIQKSNDQIRTIQRTLQTTQRKTQR